MWQLQVLLAECWQVISPLPLAETVILSLVSTNHLACQQKGREITHQAGKASLFLSQGNPWQETKEEIINDDQIR